MTQLTFTFESVPNAPIQDSFVTPTQETNEPVPTESNVVITGRIPLRRRRQGLRQLSEVLTDVLARYEDIAK